jgi:hypothetical protein
MTALALSACVFGKAWGQAVFVINSNGDAGLANSGQTTCSTGSTVNVPGIGTVDECTLRAALQAANNQSQAVTIEYASTMACMDLLLIEPQSAFPPISNTITVDAQTHPCASTIFTHYPIIDGDSVSTTSAGLELSMGSDGSRLEGMQLENFLVGLAIFASQDVVVDSVRVHNSRLTGILMSSVLNASVIDSVVEASGREQTADGIRVEGGFGTEGVLIRGSKIHGSSGNGIRLAGGSEIRVGQTLTISSFPNPLIVVCDGNEIHNNGGHGVHISASDVQVQCNDIHDNNESGVAIGSGEDILIGGDGSGTQISPYLGNRIHANAAHGIETWTGGELDIIGNWIGTNSNGDELGNTLDGIQVQAGLLPETAGQTTRIHRNDIAYNGNGIVVDENGIAEIHSNQVLANVADGVVVRNFGTALGGNGPSRSNIIGNNGRFGVLVEPPPEDDGAVFVFNNWIGTDETGADLGNQVGVGVHQSGTETYQGHVLIGAFTAAHGGGWSNTIGHNQVGIEVIDGHDVRISGNYIGTNAQGDNLANEAGIEITGSDLVQIGKSSQDYDSTNPGVGMGNVIAYNDQAIELKQSTTTGAFSKRVSILGNRFQGNGPRAISLGEGGNVIDPGGGANGNNKLQNFPEVDDVDTFYDDDSGLVHYRFRVSTNADNATYPLRVDFYLADGTSAQGLHWIGYHQYSSATANSWVSGTFEPPEGINLQGGYLTAMATDAAGNSSEFLSDLAFLAEVIDVLFRDRFEQE